MEQPDMFEKFSLLGGPLHRIGSRLGLVRGAANTVGLGFALGIFLWVVLVALSLAEGIGGKAFSLTAIGAHVRLLLAIPLFFICETLVDPRMTIFVRKIVDGEVVPKPEWPALASETARCIRIKDSWLPDLTCLMLAVLTTPFVPFVSHWGLSGGSGLYDPGQSAATTLAGQWYFLVCLPVFRFLVFRWLWRLGLWCFFLWRVSRLKLQLIPTHPDKAGGLGYLEVVQTQFMPLIVAISAIQSAGLAEEIAVGTSELEAAYAIFALILCVDAVLFLSPLCIFSPSVSKARQKGMVDYMGFASRYVNDFDKKWLRSSEPAEPLLGTPDLQSLADLANSVDRISKMRLVPTGKRMLAMFAFGAALPMLPLLLLEYPIADLIRRVFSMLLGL